MKSPPIGLDALTTAILIIDETLRVVFANHAAQALSGHSSRSLGKLGADQLFTDKTALSRWRAQAQAGQLGVFCQSLHLNHALHGPIMVHAVVSVPDEQRSWLMIELHDIESQLRFSSQEQELGHAKSHWLMLRNLAHEIKNPLGGIRGAAQLLAHELSASQREYTQVVIEEADRLQALVDQLLAPAQQLRQVARYNIHEVCEHVRKTVLAEFSVGLRIECDYDASVPLIEGDKAQLIQALLNIVRNAAQALGYGATDNAKLPCTSARIILRTRVARHVTIAGRQHRLAIFLHVIDNGPGVDDELKPRIFFPLVTGREGGTGLGLSLAQAYVQANGGMIELDCEAGHTDFKIVLPLELTLTPGIAKDLT